MEDQSQYDRQLPFTLLPTSRERWQTGGVKPGRDKMFNYFTSVVRGRGVPVVPREGVAPGEG